MSLYNLRNRKKNIMELNNVIQLLPNFHANPSENIDYFLDQFNKISKLADLSPDVKIILIKTKLQNNAADFIREDDISKINDYDQLCEKLKLKFSKTFNFEDCQKQFMECKQRDNSVSAYAELVQKSAKNYLAAANLSNNTGAKELAAKITLSRFLDGLREDIKFEVSKFGPQSMEQALTTAKRMENALNNTVKEINVTKDIQNEDLIQKLIQTNLEQKLELQKFEQEIKLLKQKDKDSKVKCQVCFKNNHDTAQCRFAQNAQFRAYQPRVTYGPSFGQFPRFRQPNQGYQNFRPFNNFRQNFYHSNVRQRNPTPFRQRFNFSNQFQENNENTLNYRQLPTMNQNKQPVITYPEEQNLN